MLGSEPVRPPVVDYPNLAELAGLTIERTNDRVAFHVLPKAFRHELWDVLRLLLGISMALATLTATIITIAVEVELSPGDVLTNLIYVAPCYAFPCVLLALPLTYWCSHRRLLVEVSADAVTMTMHSLLPDFCMTWQRRRISQLRRDGDGIWVYVDGGRDGRITCPSGLQNRLLLRALCTELRLECRE